VNTVTKQFTYQLRINLSACIATERSRYWLILRPRQEYQIASTCIFRVLILILKKVKCLNNKKHAMYIIYGIELGAENVASLFCASVSFAQL
jgi:hypothetical protein